MKTIKFSSVWVVFSFMLILAGCAKIEPDSAYLPNTSEAKADLIERINTALSVTELPKSGTIDARNLNNFMDGFGQYFEEMLVFINQSEAVNPSNTEAEYISRYSDYLDAHPIPYDFTDLVYQDQDFFGQLADIIRAHDGGSAELTVEQLRNLENILVETTLIPDLEKEALLALTSFRKFVIATIEVHGVSVMGNTIISTSPLMSCFEDEFNASFQECTSVLSDIERPFSMFVAWSSLGTFMAACIGDAVVAGFINC
ncbi:MAG TPA: hypothetical protein VKY29_04450 [Cryomorphaceae bacterium]|nr:hypothetical protein [Cryomorphaceae bacterium]